jgi:hypothetical protein
MVIVGSLLMSSVAFAQTRTETADPVVIKFGFSTGILARHGESFDGTNTALGGWSTISVGRWGIDADFSRSRQLERRGEACLDRVCSRSAAGTEVETNVAMGIAALRHIRARGRTSPHMLIGIGAISRRSGYRFDDPALGGRDESTWWGWGPVAGLGLDVSRGRYVARAQYRWNFRVEDSIHQFRVGFGWGS